MGTFDQQEYRMEGRDFASPRETPEEIARQIRAIAFGWEQRGVDWWTSLPLQPRELLRRLVDLLDPPEE